ncbi:MAG: hypothetical protein WD875_07690 [Pirellulales bacterium]
MSENSKDTGFFDPTAMFKNMRDTGMGAWSKMMIDMVGTESYAKAQGEILDAWLSNSAPFRKVMESATTQTLANLNMPSRDDITRLAERLTNIEMKLDDLDAKIDGLCAAGTKVAATKKKAKGSEEDDK